jgi:fatty acid desaturase
MNEIIKIDWYRSKVDKALLNNLMRKSDARAFAQVLPQLALFGGTGALAYLAFLNIHAANWTLAVPLVLMVLFVHGSLAHFFGGSACHELTHKTPFRTPFWNSFFLSVYAFLGWFHPVSYRVSHVKHHQATVHEDLDGEVILPQGMDWHGVSFILEALTCNPFFPLNLLRNWSHAAFGDPSRSSFLSADWMGKILPESNIVLRRDFRNWARTVLFGHLVLASLFFLTGHWFLIIIVNFGTQYCGWLELLCGAPQHIGLASNVSDFRLCCRTYTCGRFPGFLYWNMQYHLEHHMYPAVPFYNLPRLREAIEHDLPPATHGLWATWKELIPIMQRQRREPDYVFLPCLPPCENQ